MKISEIVQRPNTKTVKEMTAGGTGAGAVATGMGGGNGFVNGGPGTITRYKKKGKKK